MTKSEIFKSAWEIKKGINTTFRWALTKVHLNNNNLRDLRTKEEHTFKYYKVNGELRVARGTLKVGCYPTTNLKGTRRVDSRLQTYYDLDKQEWRCYRKLALTK